MRRKVLVCTLCIAAFFTLSSGLVLAKKSTDRFEPLKRFSDIMDRVEKYYVRDVDRNELVEGAVKGMLQDLDPHSAYLTKADFDEMKVSTSGEFSGIGIEISMKNNQLIVVSPIEDTPAYKAGLQARDLILEINGKSTEGITLMEAVKQIRGKKGTAVKLTVLSDNDKTPRVVSIVRDTIPIISVKSEILEDGYVYLRVTRFNEHTTSELHAALKQASKKGAIKGVVLDLRNNPGGLLDQAVTVADTFLSEGKIVYIKGKEASSRKDFLAKNSSSDVKAPMVVLINGGSASASEIVAGALQDHKRALLVGSKSFGKGSVQTIIPLYDGAGMKLTTALYYTPNDRSIQAEGIVPDYDIPRNRDALSRFAVRESDLNKHLENSGKNKKKSKSDKERVKKMLSSDNQLKNALKLLKQKK